MSFQKTPIALAVVALCAGASFGAQAAPSVTITSPANNSTVSGTVNCSANASDSSGISNVAFYLDGIGLKDLYHLGRTAFSLNPDQIQNITIPITNGGCLGLAGSASSLFADFRDNGIVGS